MAGSGIVRAAVGDVLFHSLAFQEAVWNHDEVMGSPQVRQKLAPPMLYFPHLPQSFDAICA